MVDITSNPGVAAISSGDLNSGGIWEKENAFDDVLAYSHVNAWASSHSNASSPDVEQAGYIGIDLGEGVTATVDSIDILQHPATDNNSITGTNQIDFEYSQNGSDWTTHEQLSPTFASIGSTPETLTFAATSPSARFFRLNPNKNPPGVSGSVWGIQELVFEGTIDAPAGGGDGGINMKISTMLGLGL